MYDTSSSSVTQIENNINFLQDSTEVPWLMEGLFKPIFYQWPHLVVV